MGQVQIQSEARMCLSPDSYVGAVVTQRLLDRGVPRKRAEGVGRKVARAYRQRRLGRLTSRYPAADGDKLLGHVHAVVGDEHAVAERRSS